MQSSDEEIKGTENRSKSQKGRLANWLFTKKLTVFNYTDYHN